MRILKLILRAILLGIILPCYFVLIVILIGISLGINTFQWIWTPADEHFHWDICDLPSKLCEAMTETWGDFLK